MYPGQPFVEPEGMYPQNFGPYPGMGQMPHKPMPAPFIGEPQYNIDARLDRIEREIIEINRRLNSVNRQIRRIENFLNIRD